MTLLVSVHVPKTAGIALRAALTQAWPSHRVFLDYADRPLDPAAAMHIDPDGFRERWQRMLPDILAGYDVAHGHFNPAKYAGVPNARWITFVREPVRRLVSHYYFWRAWPRSGNRLHEYMLDNALSLYEFARLPCMRRVYTGVFFAGVDVDRFDFVGAQERFDADVARLERLLGRALPMPDRTNETQSTEYDAAVADILDNPKQVRALEDLLADDLRFYARYAA